MKSVKVVIASTKRLIAKSIQRRLLIEGNVSIQAVIFNKEDLTDFLQESSLDVLIIDQQMVSDLFVWKNMHPKTLKRAVKVLLIASEKYSSAYKALPGFIPNQIAYWEDGMDELVKSFDLMKKKASQF